MLQDIFIPLRNLNMSASCLPTGLHFLNKFMPGDCLTYAGVKAVGIHLDFIPPCN